MGRHDLEPRKRLRTIKDEVRCRFGARETRSLSYSAARIEAHTAKCYASHYFGFRKPSGVTLRQRNARIKQGERRRQNRPGPAGSVSEMRPSEEVTRRPPGRFCRALLIDLHGGVPSHPFEGKGQLLRCSENLTIS